MQIIYLKKFLIFEFFYVKLYYDCNSKTFWINKKEIGKLTAGKIFKILEINSKIFFCIVIEKKSKQVKHTSTRCTSLFMKFDPMLCGGKLRFKGSSGT